MATNRLFGTDMLRMMTAARHSQPAGQSGCYSKPSQFMFAIHARRNGERWAVSLEIFLKARGDQLEFTEASIACVFKKFTGELPDARPQVHMVELNG